MIITDSKAMFQLKGVCISQTPVLPTHLLNHTFGNNTFLPKYQYPTARFVSHEDGCSIFLRNINADYQSAV